VVKVYNIDAASKAQYQEQIEAAAVIYSTAKTNAVTYRNALTPAILELSTGLSSFFHSMLDNLLTKLLSFNPLSPLSTLIDGLVQTANALVLKAAYILDTLAEVTKAIAYGKEHVATIPAEAAKLVKSADFENYLNILGSAVPATVTTITAVQGGLAVILANLHTMANTGILSLLTQFSVALLPTGPVLPAWTALQVSAIKQQADLRDVLTKIQAAATAAATAT
jgi:hypothetical protein